MTTLMPRPTLRPVLGAALLAGLLAALVNGALFLLTRGSFEGVLAGPRQMAFTVAPVMSLSLIGALGAGIVYALLARFTRRPGRIFAVVALAVLLVSFASPFSIPNVPTAVALLLNLMHVVVYALVMALVPRRAAKG